MVGGLVFVLFLAVGLVTLGVALALVPRRRRSVALDETTHPRLASLRRKTTWARVTGIAAGAAAAWFCATSTAAWAHLGRGVMVAPLVFGAVLLLALITGDTLAHKDARTGATGPRRSSAVDEGQGSPLPRGMALAVAAATVACLGLLVTGWILGAPDDMGRPGRALRTSSPDGSYHSVTGPWPGELYGAVALPAVLIVVALLLAGLMIVRRRPLDRTDSEIGRVDAVLRSRESEAMLAAAGLGIGGLTVGLVIFMAPILLGAEATARLSGYEPGPGYTIGGCVALATGLYALAVVVWSGVTLVVPGPAKAHGPRTAVVAGAGTAR